MTRKQIRFEPRVLIDLRTHPELVPVKAKAAVIQSHHREGREEGVGCLGQIFQHTENVQLAHTHTQAQTSKCVQLGGISVLCQQG